MGLCNRLMVELAEFKNALVAVNLVSWKKW